MPRREGAERQRPDGRGITPSPGKGVAGRPHAVELAERRQLRSAGQGLWHELAFYGGFVRLDEVVEILPDECGTRMLDRMPSRASEILLCGDVIGSPSRIDRVRERPGPRENAGSDSDTRTTH